MDKTVFLVVKNMDGKIDPFIIPLINERNKHIASFPQMVVGDKWGKLRDAFTSSHADKGRAFGGETVRFKRGVEHWVLPFRDHPLMQQPARKSDAWVMTEVQYKNAKWDETDSLGN